MKIPDWVAKRIQSALSGNAAVSFFKLFMGRCTFFALTFSVIGCYGWLIKGRDLTSFAMFAGAIQALLLAHSYKEDVAAQNQNTTIVNDITVQK